ncbi:hypothetical protein Hrd1104_09095 [Halorhabdus sp. CBA1104]|uniref:DUF7344 domain-containing protein n=1 Tax=Halorhabdus sp. CBA1104 TaxID=1380432 RepID=UPI0012B1CD9C|nr:hypothetical protein [Halorhabdus sp. CBA1104]QGN07450.1 hypothetical protein Hrd1104_09095 [Halorhabdus sp. CBA1104]
MVASATDGTQQTDSALSRDEAFDLLSNHRRRYALHAVKQTEESVELAEIAEKVAAWENDKDRKDVTSTERHRVYTSLQQTHLPTMDRAGVIDFDNGTVTLTAQAEALDIYMDVVPEDSIPWGQYYLGLAALSSGLVAGAWAGVFPSSIPDLAWAILVIVLLAGSALYHVWQSRQFRVGVGEQPPEIDR